MTDAARHVWENQVDFQVLPGTRQHLQIEHLPEALEAHDLWSVLVEGGGDTQRRFLDVGLWDRMYLYRNDSLQLQGKIWSAADAWRRQQAQAIELQVQEWQETRCTVYTHREAWQQKNVALQELP